jgi:NAD(P)-dependent dehydrogenase (short-subunit alcohol dehydrogenase family)
VYPSRTGQTGTVANILITGASDGLGRALARELAAAGHQLVVHGRDAGRLAGIARETGAVAIRADLSSLDEVRALAARAAEPAAGIEVLVNNAGVGFGAPGAGRELSRDGALDQAYDPAFRARLRERTEALLLARRTP